MDFHGNSLLDLYLNEFVCMSKKTAEPSNLRFVVIFYTCLIVSLLTMICWVDRISTAIHATLEKEYSSIASSTGHITITTGEADTFFGHRPFAQVKYFSSGQGVLCWPLHRTAISYLIEMQTVNWRKRWLLQYDHPVGTYVSLLLA